MNKNRKKFVNRVSNDQRFMAGMLSITHAFQKLYGESNRDLEINVQEQGDVYKRQPLQLLIRF